MTFLTKPKQAPYLFPIPSISTENIILEFEYLAGYIQKKVSKAPLLQKRSKLYFLFPLQPKFCKILFKNRDQKILLPLVQYLLKMGTFYFLWKFSLAFVSDHAFF